MASTNKLPRAPWLGWRVPLLLAAFVLLPVVVRHSEAQAGPPMRHPTTREVIQPQFPGKETAPPISAEALAALQELHYQSREAVAARVDNNPPSPPGLPDIPVAEAGMEAPEWEFHGAPTSMFVGSNSINTVVPIAPSARSTLGEPAVGNIGEQAFYTGNAFASFTTDDGTSWSDRAFPPPAIAGETVCCDQDVEVDQGRNRVFWSLLYLNPARTHGTVIIAVLPSPSSPPACTYTINPGTNTVPDYPHLGLSNDFLYLNTNNINTQGTLTTADDTWTNSQMRRITLDAMVDCATVTIDTFTFGPPTFTSQRVFVPFEGAEDRMFWGVLDNTTTFRLFEWRETSLSPSSTTRTITASVFTDPDCRGGTNNTDWIVPGTPVSITGFRMRGWYGQPPGGGGQDVVGALWNVGPDASHTQGHIHAAVFDVNTKNLLSGTAGQPHFANNSFCLAYPDTAVTERGHVAMIFGRGGKAGGGGGALINMVVIGDDTQAGIASGWGASTTIATGTHNPPSGSRYGDYLTIQQHEPCDLFMVASSYVFSGGTAASNVQHRYVEFGRRRDSPCWDFRHLEP